MADAALSRAHDQRHSLEPSSRLPTENLKATSLLLIVEFSRPYGGLAIPGSQPVFETCYRSICAIHKINAGRLRKQRHSMDYRHPRIADTYDLAYPRGEDTDFYISLAGHRPSSILDLGCGTGTLCCALAERRHQVTGVDPAPAMLAVAKSKTHSEQVEWVESSAQGYKSHRRFDLIVMTGHAFQILLTDADALAVLGTMRDHLNHRGRIAFETRNPRLDWAREWAAGQPRVLPGGEILETLKITGAENEFISFETSYRFPDATLTTSSTLRFPSREHVEDLIACGGLVVRDVFGDWAAGPFAPAQSREIIFIAETAR